MVAEVFAGISAFSAMLNTAKTLREMDNTVSRNEAVIDLQGQILTAQENYAALLGNVRELETKLAALESWETEKQRYQPVQFEPGVTIYSLKSGMEGAEHGQHFCAQCYANRKARVLQATDKIIYRRRIRVCNECKTEMGYGAQAAPPRPSFANSDYDPLDR